jgi:hypothetical protein
MKNRINFTFKIVLVFVLSMTTHSALPTVRNIQKLGIGTGVVGAMLAVNKWRQGDKVEDVWIYHTTASEANLRSIKRNGLRSVEGALLRPLSFIRCCKEIRPELTTKDCLGYYLENLDMCLKNKSALGFADQFSVIYFKPEEPGVKESANIAIKVNPYTTYVYNLDHRGHAYYQRPEEDELYRKSRVLLADYLKHLETAKKMVEERPDVMVLLDPETAEPFYLEQNDPRMHQVKINGQWVEYAGKEGIGRASYNAEVIVNTTCIPVRKLMFINDKISSCPSSTPVINKTDYFKR